MNSGTFSRQSGTLLLGALATLGSFSCIKAQLVNLAQKSSVESPLQTFTPSVAITAPLASVKIVTSNQSAFPLSGTCSEAGQNVVISGDVNATVLCSTSGTWNYSPDVSALADGLISFTVDHSNAAGTSAPQDSRNYTKDTTPPAVFTITGVTGGTDVTADAYLLDQTTAIIGWNDTTGEDSYDVVIRKASDNSVMCALVSKVADSTSHDFSTCTLTYGQDYKAIVIAKDVDGNEREATHSPFTFKVNRTPSVTVETILVAKNASATTISVLSNDTDADSDTLTVASIDTTGTSGTVTNGTTNVSYTPSSGFTGVDTFTYTATDSRGGTSTATVTVKVMDPFTWTGGGANANWATSGNWCGTVTAGACPGGAAPNGTQTAIFDGTCVSNCSPTIAATINVGGVKMNSGYAGTITQGAFTMTIGTTGWTQTAGTFTGSASNISISGPTSITGGTFTATSGRITYSNDFTIGNSATFSHNNGELQQNHGCCTIRTLNVGNATLYDLTYAGHTTTAAISGTVKVANHLKFNSTNSANGGVNGGTIEASGDVTMIKFGGGTTLIKIVGSGTQTITGVDGESFPKLEIASTGTVNLVGTITTMQGFVYTSAGAYNRGTAGLAFVSANGGTTAINPGNFTYDHLKITPNVSTLQFLSDFTVSGSTTFIDGGWTYSTYSGSATIDLQGDVTVGSQEVRLSTSSATSPTFRISGSGAQTFTGSGYRMPNLIIASSNNVTIAGSIAIGGAFTYSSGTVDASASTLRFLSVSGSGAAVTPGSMAFGNVIFDQSNGQTLTVSAPMDVRGDVTFASTGSASMSGSPITIHGNISRAAGGMGTINNSIILAGSGNQTLDVVSNPIRSTLTVDKTAGSITLLSDLTLSTNNQDLLFNNSSASMSMGGFALLVKRTLDLNGSTLTKGGGILTVNSAAAGTGSLFNGTVDP